MMMMTIIIVAFMFIIVIIISVFAIIHASEAILETSDAGLPQIHRHGTIWTIVSAPQTPSTETLNPKP